MAGRLPVRRFALRRMWAALKGMVRDTGASVAVITALSMPPLIGFGSLALDLEQAMNQKVRLQMIADAGALSAAIAFDAGGNDSNILSPTAQAIAVANGIKASEISASVVSDYPTAGASAVKVSVTVRVPVTAGRIFGAAATFPVTTTAYASIVMGNAFQPCILALSNASSAIMTTGGGTISASSCDVAAVGGINNQGASISAAQLLSTAGGVTNNSGSLVANLIQYATTFSNPGWNTSVPAASKIRKATGTKLVDYWDGVSALTNLRSQIGTYTAPATIPTLTMSGGPKWDFNFSPQGPIAGYQTSSGSGVYVVPKGNYNVDSISVAGGVKVTFTAGTNIAIAKGLSSSGTINFGSSNVYVNNGFSVSNGMTMGDGTLWIGPGTTSFSGTTVVGNGQVVMNSDVTISGGSTLTLGAGAHAFKSVRVQGGGWVKMGAGDLDVTNDVRVDGGSTLVAGPGAVRLGKNGSGNSIELSGSAVMITGDGAFSTSGGMKTDGGSRMVIGNTGTHFINGTMSIAGSLLLGTGSYVINGNFINGTGGTTWPYSDPISGKTYGSSLQGTSTAGYDVAGVYATIVLSGTVNLGGGAKTILIAPTGASGVGLADLIIDSVTNAATTWAAGTTNTFIGAVHLPNSAVAMSGGASTASSGKCFMLTASTITVSGGAVTSTKCSSVNQATAGGNSGTAAQLVG